MYCESFSLEVASAVIFGHFAASGIPPYGPQHNTTRPPETRLNSILPPALSRVNIRVTELLEHLRCISAYQSKLRKKGNRKSKDVDRAISALSTLPIRLSG